MIAIAACSSDGPSAAPMASASSSDGNARKMSTMRIRTSSIQPPAAPASRPMGTPMASDAPMMMTAVPSEMSVPNSTRDSTSRPTESVPRRCSAPGALRVLSRSVAVPASLGYGAMTGAATAARTSSSAMPAPTARPGWRAA